MQKQISLITKELLEDQSKNKIFRELSRVSQGTDFSKAQGYNGKYLIEDAASNGFYCVNSDGNIESIQKYDPNVGIRPLIKYSTIRDEVADIEELPNGLKRVKWGEYPQRKLSSNDCLYWLERQSCYSSAYYTYMYNSLEQTEKKYVIGNKKLQFDIKNSSTLIGGKNNLYELIEYKYISNQKYVNYFDNWYCVEPVSWLVDEENDIAISENVIFGKISFGFRTATGINYYFGAWSLEERYNDMFDEKELGKYRTNVDLTKEFMNYYLLPDLISEQKEKSDSNNKVYSKKKK